MKKQNDKANAESIIIEKKKNLGSGCWWKLPFGIFQYLLLDICLWQLIVMFRDIKVSVLLFLRTCIF